MKIIVGLGNPGKEYELTRHNVGFMALDFLMKEWRSNQSFYEVGREKNKLYESVEFDWYRDEGRKAERMILLTPQTFMNESGKAVKKCTQYSGNAFDLSSDLIVIHDELDLHLGKMKIETNASSAGHHGVQNIIDLLGTQEFIRFRIGITPEVGIGEKAEDFVLKRFNQQEQTDLENVFGSIVDTLQELLRNDIETARNRYYNSVNG
ncbi:aminoacyl-tRNA hydrolase [Candidatus Uhrbacteria bacterium]|nr:aminoacyl-tRNA hydrolase [Candidatus Uhrbacteria bacterium]